MAIQRVGVYEITYTVRDRKGKDAFFKLHLPKYKSTDATDDGLLEGRADPDEFAWEMAKVIDDLMGGWIVNISVASSVNEFSFITPQTRTFKVLADEDADVEEGAIFVYESPGNSSPFQHRIPTFSEDFLLVGGTVDTGATEVAAYLTMMTHPEDLPANWLIAPCTSRGDDLSGLLSNKENFKRSK